MRRALICLVLLALVVVGVLVARRGSFAPFGRTRPNLLLISIDTLRADRLGSYGHAEAATPRLDALGARGLRFEQATTVAPLTLPAHSSLLTGTFPATHGVRDNVGFKLADEQVTLAETLQGEGYRTGAFVGAFVLDSRFGLHQGFDRYFDEFHLSRMKGRDMVTLQRRGDEVVAEALAEDPEIVEAYTLLGNFHEKAGRPQEAMKAHQQAVALSTSRTGAPSSAWRWPTRRWGGWRTPRTASNGPATSTPGTRRCSGSSRTSA